MSTQNSAVPSANHQIVNGDFENLTQGVGSGTSAFGWTSAGAASGVSGGDGYDHRVEGHGYALGGWSNSSGQSIAQTVQTEAGAAYTLVFDAGLHFGALRDGLLDVEIEGASGARTLVSLGADDLGARQTFALDFVALDAATTVRFVYDGNGAASSTDIDLDNIELQARSPANDGLRVFESETAGDTETLEGGVTSLLGNDATGAQIVSVNGMTGLLGEWVDLDKGRVMILADGTVDFDAQGDFDALNSGESDTVSVVYSTGTTSTGELLVNGDFETHDHLGRGSGGNRWDVFSSIEGWTTLRGAVEIQQGAHGGTPVNNTSNSVVELDSHGLADTNGSMQQEVELPAAGSYTFAFDYAPRGLGSRTAQTNALDVLVDGEVVDTIVTATLGYQRYEYQLDLDAGAHTVGFAAGGTADGMGPLIDNVSLQGDIAQTASLTIEVQGEDAAPLPVEAPPEPEEFEGPAEQQSLYAQTSVAGEISAGGVDLSGSAGAEADAGAYFGANGYYVGAYAQADIEGSASVDLGGGVSLDVHVGATAFAGAYTDFYVDGTTVRMGGKAGAGVTGEAGVDVGTNIGDGAVGAGTDVEVNVGVIASGDGEINFGDGSYGTAGEAGAFAGAGVSVTVRSDSSYDNVGSAGAGAGGSVGNVGVAGGGNAGYEDGKISFGLNGDLALGLGIKFDFQVEIDTHYLQEGALALADVEAVAQAATVVAAAAGEAARATEEVAEDFANGAVDAANAVAELGEEATQALGALGQAAAEAAQQAADAFEDGAGEVANAVAGAADDAADAVVSAVDDAREAAVAAAEAAEAAADAARDAANDIAAGAQLSLNLAQAQLGGFIDDAFRAYNAALFSGVSSLAGSFEEFMNNAVTEVFGNVLGGAASEAIDALGDVVNDIAGSVGDAVGDAVDDFVGGIGSGWGIFSKSVGDPTLPAIPVPTYVSQDVVNYVGFYFGPAEEQLNRVMNAGEPVLRAMSEAAVLKAMKEAEATGHAEEAAEAAALASTLTALTPLEYAAQIAQAEAVEAQADFAALVVDLQVQIDALQYSIDQNTAAFSALALLRAEAEGQAQQYRDALVALEAEPLPDDEKAQMRAELEQAIGSVMDPVDAQDAQLRALIADLEVRLAALQDQRAAEQAYVDQKLAAAAEAQLRADYETAVGRVADLEAREQSALDDFLAQEGHVNDDRQALREYEDTLRELQIARDQELVRLTAVLEEEKQKVFELEEAAIAMEDAVWEAYDALDALTEGTDAYAQKAAELAALENALNIAWDAYFDQENVIQAADDAVYRHEYQGDNSNYGSYQIEMLEEAIQTGEQYLDELYWIHSEIADELSAARDLLAELTARHDLLEPLGHEQLEALEAQLWAEVNARVAVLMAEADAALIALEDARVDYADQIAEAEARAAAAQTDSQIAAAQGASTLNKAEFLASDEGNAQIAAVLAEAQEQLQKAQLYYAETDHALALAQVQIAEEDLSSLRSVLADLGDTPDVADARDELQVEIKQVEEAYATALESAQAWTETLMNLIANHPVAGAPPELAEAKLAELDGLLVQLSADLAAQPVNLTEELRGTATASASSIGWGSEAMAVLDADTSAGNWAHTFNGANEYIQVDLKDEYGITRLEIVNRVESSGDRLNGAEVVLLDASGAETHRFAPITGAETGERLMFTTATPVDAQFMRIEHSNQYLHVAEIEVFGIRNAEPPLEPGDDLGGGPLEFVPLLADLPEDDVFVWHEGDGSGTVEGGLHLEGDKLQVNAGTPLGQEVEITASGARVMLERMGPAGFQLDIGTTEMLEVIGETGDDMVTAHSGVGPLILLEMRGGGGADTLRGAEGDDLLEGGEGNDMLNGGGGFDTVVYSASTTGVQVSLEANMAHDGGTYALGVYSGATETDRIYGAENIVGSAFADLLQGKTGSAAVIDAGDGHDRVETGIRNDAVTAGAGDDTVMTGAGADSIIGIEGADTINGGAGFDTVDLSSALGDVYVDLEGNVIQTGGTSQPYNVYTGATATSAVAGVENIIGSAFDDILLGKTGSAAVIAAGDGDDQVTTGVRNDFVAGGAGADLIDTGAGSDTVFEGAGNDTTDAGAGYDTVDYGTSTTGVSVDLGANVGLSGGFVSRGAYISATETDTLINFEFAAGSAFDDILIGDNGRFGKFHGRDGDDLITGGNRGDRLNGDAGRDMLNGLAGNDKLNGGIGADWLTGGAGRDTFIFDNTDGVDRVYDFEQGRDVVDLTFFGSGASVAFAQDGANVEMHVDGTLIAIFERQIDSDFTTAGDILM